jgi:hypothetical protein
MHETIIKLGPKQGLAVKYNDDVEAILDLNKELRTIEQKSDWGRHIAEIPNIVMLKWLSEAWERGQDIRYLSPEFNEIVAEKLKDPEWSYLRTDCKSTRTGWT